MRFHIVRSNVTVRGKTSDERKAARIYLTATPDETWKRKLKQGKQKGVIVSGRYHRHPLPVPLFCWCGNWKNLIHKKNSSSFTTVVTNILK